MPSSAVPSSGSRIQGSSEVAAAIRSTDWHGSLLGPLEAWPDSLVANLNMILAAAVPLQMFWGPELLTFYNDALLPTLADKHPAALGKPGPEVWAEAWDEVGPQITQVLRKGTALKFEQVPLQLLQNGKLQETYWNYSYSPLYSAAGAVEGVLNIASEMTQLVRAEQDLRAAEAESRRILQSIGDAVIVTDADKRVVRMNPVAEKLTRWPLADASGQLLADVFRIVNEATGETVENPADKVARLGTAVGLANHTVLIGRDGTRTHIDDSGAPIRNLDGTLAGIVLVFRDVSERREVERDKERLQRLNGEALAAMTVSEARFRALFDNAPVGITVNGNDGRLIDCNQAYQDITGRTLEELRELSYLDLTYSEDQAFNSSAFDAVTRQEASGFSVDKRYVLPDGTLRWVRATAVPLPTTHGTPDRVVGIVIDVDAQKKAQDVVLRTEKLAAVGRLAASIAHEINNPLESVTNLLYLARTSAEHTEIQDYLKLAERELRRVSAISNQTLRFYRQSTRQTPVNTQDLTEGVLTIYQGRLVNSHVEVMQRLRAERPVLCFDGEIRQVLNNLVGNAIDAIHPTGGTLWVRSREGQEPRLGTHGVFITIADNGPGIPSSNIKKIFEPFFTTKGIGGSGLGLWLSCEIVSRHKGTLRVRSSTEPGRHYTAFTMFLPFDATDGNGSSIVPPLL